MKTDVRSLYVYMCTCYVSLLQELSSDDSESGHFGDVFTSMEMILRFQCFLSRVNGN